MDALVTLFLESLYVRTEQHGFFDTLAEFNKFRRRFKLKPIEQSDMYKYKQEALCRAKKNAQVIELKAGRNKKIKLPCRNEKEQIA